MATAATNGYTVLEGREGWAGETGSGRPGAGDPFAPLVAAALPVLSRAARAGIRRLLPVARRAAVDAVKALVDPPGAPSGGARPGVPAPHPGPAPGVSGRPRTDRERLRAIGRLLHRMRRVLRDGESGAVRAEAAMFGAPGAQPELGDSAQAREAALTEVLAAEAAHAPSAAEAQALLGAALPLALRVMGAGHTCRPYVPALTRANATLVGTLRAGPGGPDLLRLVPPIHRRTIGSLLAALRAGRPVPPAAVPQVMAGHAARVLSRPGVAGPALARNLAVRRTTVAPPGPPARPSSPSRPTRTTT